MEDKKLILIKQKKKIKKLLKNLHYDHKKNIVGSFENNICGIGEEE